MVDFVLVVPLVVLVAMAVLQLVLVLHVRSTLVAAAAEGARAAALAGADADAGVARARDLLDGTIAGSVVRDVRAGTSRSGDLEVLAVRVEAVLPLLGLFGPTALVVEGHALREGWR